MSKTYIKDIKKLLMSLQKEDIEEHNKIDIPISIPDRMKFKVNGDVELSKAIRVELRRLGFPDLTTDKWYDKQTYIFAYTKDRYNRVTGGHTHSHYNEHEGTETTLEELKLMKPDEK